MESENYECAFARKLEGFDAAEHRDTVPSVLSPSVWLILCMGGDCLECQSCTASKHMCVCVCLQSGDIG